ncbi:GDP-mannose pyrophosphatase NudK [Dyadobacter flavalbus]|uniref:GDP-mannose pyrophosphatase n=1 Tax=Dyadobacter flavalbus TaxID=2579942 RepID=A0A5M8QXL2_9BACT|nr:GDP-mannose pyrophosphatase NudK [Dyadobacter flavalbus]KAA6440121.1 GDP-mannose pyrophosphatase NudK [Dyadobacter flavalbus]
MNNDKVTIISEDILSDNWYTLKKYTFDYQREDGKVERQSRESYDRGNGATILLYNTEKQTVLLTRQFRIPSYVNGNPSGMLIEACAGLLDKDNPEDCIIRETEEETGYKIRSVQKIYEAYMSPGSVTEILYYFIAEYSDDMKVSQGGGKEQEQENIEVMEVPFVQALEMMKNGEIKDAKTIILLQYAQINGLFGA